MNKNRLCIYPKDISLILGKSTRQSERILSHIRVVLKKKKHQYVTISEFAEYADIPEEEVMAICR